MKLLPLTALLLTVPIAAASQEKPVPKNDVRVQIPGCAYNRTFISEEAPATEGVGAIKPGRRFKMNAKKELERYLEGNERDENAPPSMRGKR